MSVFMVCEKTLGLLRGNRLILTDSQKEMLENLDYDGLAYSVAQDEALSCARHFASVRDRLLQTDPWVCARATVMPAMLEEHNRDWPFTYALPNDCIKILSLVRGGGHRSPRTIERWEQFGKTVSCLYPVAELRYTRRLTNTDDWSPLFESTFCFSLAAEISASVTGEAPLYQNMEQGAQLRRQEAIRVGEIKKPLTIQTEGGGFNKFTDIYGMRYSEAEW